MEDILLGLLSAVIGGSLVVLVREFIAVYKDNNRGKQIARVVLMNELEKNHKEIEKKNNQGKTIENYIREEQKYGYNRKLFATSTWDSSKMEIARLNPSLAVDLYSVYSFYETMKNKHYTNDVPTKELDDYLKNYQSLMNKLIS